MKKNIEIALLFGLIFTIVLSTARFNIPDMSVYVPIEEKERFEKLKLNHYLDLPEIDRDKFHGIHYDQIKLF